MSDRINEAHKAFIRTLPCCVGHHCNKSEVAHIRRATFGDIVVPVDERGGVGLKPHDKHTVPLCRQHHALQHNTGEQWFWEKYAKQNPLELAQRLWENTGNRTACLGIIDRRRNGATEL